MSALTPSQIRQAARLYLLANTACLDLGGCETEEQERVIEQARKFADAGLYRYGLFAFNVSGIEKCIAVAKATTP